MTITATHDRINEWRTEGGYKENNDNFSCHGSTTLVGLGLLYEVPRSHSDTPHTVGILWTSDRLVSETCT